MSSQHYLVATMGDERHASLTRDPEMTDKEWHEYEADECLEWSLEGGEWSVDFDGCIVAWAWDGSLPDSVSRRPGRYPVDADWDDPSDPVILV